MKRDTISFTDPTMLAPRDVYCQSCDEALEDMEIRAGMTECSDCAENTRAMNPCHYCGEQMSEQEQSMWRKNSIGPLTCWRCEPQDDAYGLPLPR